MECKYVQSQLSLFIDNMLKFPAPIKEHLETCSVCQDELSLIKRTIELTASMEEILPPVDFLSMVHEEMKKEVLPSMSGHNLPIVKKYIVYIILLVSAVLLLAKIFFFKETVLSVIPVEKIHKTDFISTSSASLITMSKIPLTVPRLEEKILLSSPANIIGINAQPVPIEGDMVFSETMESPTPLPLKSPIDVGINSFPEQISLKPRLKLVFDDESMEKKELGEEGTNKPMPYNHYELGDFLIRLADYNGDYSVQLRDVVLVYEVESYSNPEELDEKRDSIKDIVQGIVSGHTAQEVKQTEKLKKELREKINTLLQEGKILQVGFKIVVE